MKRWVIFSTAVILFIFLLSCNKQPTNSGPCPEQDIADLILSWHAVYGYPDYLDPKVVPFPPKGVSLKYEKVGADLFLGFKSTDFTLKFWRSDGNGNELPDHIVKGRCEAFYKIIYYNWVEYGGEGGPRYNLYKWGEHKGFYGAFYRPATGLSQLPQMTQRVRMAVEAFLKRIR